MQPRGSSGEQGPVPAAPTLLSPLARAASLVAAARSSVAARAAEIAAASAAVLLYLPVLDFGFVFDDGALVSPDGVPIRLGGVLPYRPLRYASYTIDAWLGGTPAIYHLHNVLLHALVAAMVVALARRLGASRWPALAGGLLVAWHPLAVEAAAYVAGRRDLLCVALGVAAIHVHLAGRHAGALALLVLSAAAKESGLVFAAPLIAASLVADGAADGTADGAAGARSRTLGVAAVAAAAFAITLAYGAVGPWAPQASLAGVALPGLVVEHYLRSLAAVHSLAPEYPRLLELASRVQAGDAAAVLRGLGVGLAVGLGVAASITACRRSIRRGECGERGARAFALAWTMSVVAALGLWGGLHEPGADRHAYLLLPALGVSGALWLSSLRVARPARLAVFAIVVVLLSSSSAASRRYMEVWRSESTLWSHAVRHPSASARAHSNLARVLAAGGDYRSAARHLDSALAIEAEEPLLYVGRAALRCAQGRRALVRRDLRRARRFGAEEALVRGVELDCDRAASAGAAASAGSRAGAPRLADWADSADRGGSAT